MSTYYPKRAFEVFRERGLISLIRKSSHFLKGNKTVVIILTYVLYGRKYEAPIQPLNLIKVDPYTIKEKRNTKKFKRQQISSVEPGDWDKKTVKLAETKLYSSIIIHFQDGVPWEETEFYNGIKKSINSVEDWYKWGCSSLSDFEERLKYIDQIHESMRNNGYKKQQELHSKRGILHTPEINEVTVLIGRDGELIFHEGRHRLAIATALGIDEIPVRVLVRHEEWQEFKDDVYKNGLPEEHEELRDHPDLQDILY